MREAVRQGRDRAELEKTARDSGMVPLAEKGRALVEGGETSEDELGRVMG